MPRKEHAGADARVTPGPWVDGHGLFASDQLYASDEYDSVCDSASHTERCDWACQFGAGFGPPTGYGPGVLAFGRGVSSDVTRSLPASPAVPAGRAALRVALAINFALWAHPLRASRSSSCMLAPGRGSTRALPPACR